MKIIQINTNRSWAAHDLLEQTAVEEKADIVLISEPNINLITKRPDVWYTSEDKSAAIKITNRNLKCTGTGSGNGYVWVETDNLKIVSCYISPNVDISVFENILQMIGNNITANNQTHRTIVAGDLNAKSATWGSKKTDRRGKLLEEWAATRNLIFQNRGINPTYCKGDRNSIIDITISTGDLKILNWNVSPKESHSDHNYITYEATQCKKNKQKITLDNCRIQERLDL